MRPRASNRQKNISARNPERSDARAGGVKNIARTASTNSVIARDATTSTNWDTKRAVLASADPELSAARSPKTRNDKLFSCVLPLDLRSDGDDLLEGPSSFKNKLRLSLLL